MKPVNQYSTIFTISFLLIILTLLSGCGKQELEPVAAICYSPDGKYILAESSQSDGPALLLLIEQASGKAVKKLKGHTMGILGVDFSSDGKHVVSGSYDKLVKVWDIEKGKEVWNFEGHTDEVTAVKFSPDGTTVVSSSKDGTIRLWDISTGLELLTIDENEQQRTKIVFNIDYSPDGKFLLSCSGGALRLWDSSDGRLVKSFITQKHSYNKMANWYKMGACFSPDGKYVITGINTRMYMFDVESGEQVMVFTGRKTNIITACFSVDGKYIFAGGPGPIFMWETETGEKVRNFVDYEDVVTVSICASSDGEYLLSGGMAKEEYGRRIGSIQLWEILSGDILHLYETY